jgi:hypothetical protein
VIPPQMSLASSVTQAFIDRKVMMSFYDGSSHSCFVSQMLQGCPIQEVSNSIERTWVRASKDYHARIVSARFEHSEFKMT